MGGYAQTAADTAFLKVRYHPHQEEVARMRGKRLVFIHEVEGYLNLRPVKSIASGEATSAGFKGKDSFEFRPEAKIWFVGNEAPPTKSSGRELQRRFHVDEFIRQIAEEDIDLQLGKKLRQEAELILGWAIDGANNYYRKGLVRSPHVIDPTKCYFADADIVAQWIEERCIVERGASNIVANLFTNYDCWADDCGVRNKLDKGRLSQRLKAIGFQLDPRVMHAASRPSASSLAFACAQTKNCHCATWWKRRMHFEPMPGNEISSIVRREQTNGFQMTPMTPHRRRLNLSWGGGSFPPPPPARIPQYSGVRVSCRRAQTSAFEDLSESDYRSCLASSSTFLKARKFCSSKSTDYTGGYTATPAFHFGLKPRSSRGLRGHRPSASWAFDFKGGYPDRLWPEWGAKRTCSAR